MVTMMRGLKTSTWGMGGASGVAGRGWGWASSGLGRPGASAGR